MLNTKNSSLYSIFAVTLACFTSCETDETQIANIERTATQSHNQHYVSNQAPLQPLHFIKLPVGSIKPQGWLLAYLERQRDGLTGNLGKISAWLEKENNAWLSKDGSGDHGWEEVPYWLKGYGNIAYILEDPEMLKETKIWIEAALQSQRENGYFGPLVLRDGKPDLWGNMIMLWCLQSYYEYSQDERVIPFMGKYFKWQSTLPDSVLLEDYWENSRGGDNLYSIYWLYNRTGDKWLLDLATKIHNNTADWMQTDNLPNWHNVNIAQSFREPATYYLQTGDSSYLEATYNDFHLIREMYGNVPGGMFGADENARPGYTDPRQAVETCGMVEQMASNEILLRITGDPFWADHAENVAFNTYPAAVMPDFRALRYLTAPNMVVSDSKNHSPGIQNNGPFLMMNPFSSRCCQHNHAQGWPYYAENSWMATPDNGLAAVLYSASEVTAMVGKGSEVALKETTHYPFDEEISFIVNSSSEIRFPLYFRIPAWCKNASLSINGKKQDSKFKAGSYARVERTWKNGDEITLHLPMQIQLKTWKKNKNSVSVNRGPITYSLLIEERYEKKDSEESAIYDSKWQESADATKWPSFEIYPESPWNYALSLSGNIEKSFKVEHLPWPENNFPFTAENSPIRIKTKGKRLPDWGIGPYGLCEVLPQSPVQTDKPEEEITLIPMGAARLRISAFPQAK